MVSHRSRDANSAGVGERFQAGRNIHTVTEDVVLLNDYVAKVDADSKSYAPLLRHFGLAVDHPPLDLDGATNRVNHAGKLHQHYIASILHDPAAVTFDLRFN